MVQENHVFGRNARAAHNQISKAKNLSSLLDLLQPQQLLAGPGTIESIKC